MVEDQKVTESQLIFDHVSIWEGTKLLEEQKKEWLEKLSTNINSIQNEEELASIEKFLTLIELTLRALLQDVLQAPTQTKEPQENITTRTCFQHEEMYKEKF